MAQYIDKAAASSACNTQRAYGTDRRKQAAVQEYAEMQRLLGI